MLAINANLPAIYVQGAADDVSVGSLVHLDDIIDAWPESSIYFEPLETRSAALLNAVVSSETATAAAITDAVMFLDLLPLNVPEPAIIVEDDGQIGLDWRVGNKSLSLNLGKGGMIGYSALFDCESAYGRAPFSITEIPERIATLLLGLAEER